MKITRRGFGFLAGAAPVVGKDIAKAALAETAPVGGVAGTMMKAGVTLYPRDRADPIHTLQVLRSKHLDDLRDMLKQAKEFALGPNHMERNIGPYREEIRLDADLLTKRSFSLAGAEMIQRQRNRQKQFDYKFNTFKMRFERQFGFVFSFDDLASNKYLEYIADVDAGKIEPKNLKKTIPDQDDYDPSEPAGKNPNIGEY